MYCKKTTYKKDYSQLILVSIIWLYFNTNLSDNNKTICKNCNKGVVRGSNRGELQHITTIETFSYDAPNTV